MSIFAELQHALNDYGQLAYHSDAKLADTLHQLQDWQRERLYQTHAALFEQPQYQAMGQFLLNQLYGGETFNLLAKQLTRILAKLEKIERFMPKAALETGVATIHEAINAIKLDMQLAEHLNQHALPVNEATMIAAYQAVGAESARQEQINTLKAMCYRSHKQLKSFMLKKAFALAKAPAYKYNYHPLYDFIAEGFAAMQPIDDMAGFIEPFCAKELAIIDNVHRGVAQPFKV